MAATKNTKTDADAAATGADKRREDLTKAIDLITKEHGKGAIMRLGDAGASVAVAAIGSDTL